LTNCISKRLIFYWSKKRRSVGDSADSAIPPFYDWRARYSSHNRATKTETLTKNVAKLQLINANGYVTSLSSELQQNQQMVEKLRQLNHCIDASIRELMRI
jgi:hypothetical protein